MNNYIDLITDIMSSISFECFNEWVALCVNLMLLFIAFWTWRRTFYRKVRFVECSIKPEKPERFSPYRLKIGIENKTLVPLSIKDAILILDNKFCINILDENRDDVFILGALKTDYLTYSYTDSPDEKILNDSKVRALFIKLIGGYEISINFSKSSSKNDLKSNPYRLKQVRFICQYLNGKLLSKDVLYIASILEIGTQNLSVIYIASNGDFNRSFYEFGRIDLIKNDTEVSVQTRLQKMIDDASPNRFLVSVKNRSLFYAGNK